MPTISLRSAIQNSVPISNFNKGMAGKIFADVRSNGPKVVIKNNTPECVLMSPEEYISLLDELDDMRLLAMANAFEDPGIPIISLYVGLRDFISNSQDAFSTPSVAIA